MKSLEIIIVLCLIIFTYQSCISGTKKEDCKAENLDENTEKKLGYEYCCYVEDGDNKSCAALTKYQYENIKDYIKYMKLRSPVSEDAKIDCKSLYLEISILSILLLLL
jgi:hypothetical protein